MIWGQTSRSRAISKSAHQTHFLYRCYDADGLLLYIGSTTDPKRREYAHRAGRANNPSAHLATYLASFDVDSDRYPDRDAARRAEAAAIFAEQPLLNTQERGLPYGFIRGQIEDYLEGRPIRQWSGPVFQRAAMRPATS